MGFGGSLCGVTCGCTGSGSGGTTPGVGGVRANNIRGAAGLATGVLRHDTCGVDTWDCGVLGWGCTGGICG